MGASRSISASNQRPAKVSKMANANKRVDNAKLVAATKVPKVNTVQYTKNRPIFGRTVGTRQMRLKIDYTLFNVTNSEMIRANAPAVVSLLVLAEKSVK